jgi:hypothetical protein
MINMPSLTSSTALVRTLLTSTWLPVIAVPPVRGTLGSS